MHYTIDYSKIANEHEKHDKALQDIKDYLGEKKFDEITNIVKQAPIPRKSFIMQLGVLAGIQGYPAEAWAAHLNLQ